MVEEVRSVGQSVPQTSVPQKDVKLSDLKKTNKALYVYFRTLGVKKNAVITSEQIQRADADIKKAMGLEIKEPEQQKQPENVEERDAQGNLLKTVEHNKNSFGIDQTVTTRYFNNKKSSADIEAGQNKAFIKYNDDELPERIIESYKGDNQSFKTIDIEYENGKVSKETIKYEGNFVKNGITEQTILYENGKVVSNISKRGDEAPAAQAEEVAEPVEAAQPEKVTPTEEKAQVADQVAPEKPAKEARGKIHLPSQWNNRVSEDLRTELKLDEALDADAALEKLAQKQGVDLTKIQADKLKADLIKYNPSVFNPDGKVHDSAVWGNLDFPENTGELYKEGVATPTARQTRRNAPIKRNNPPTPPNEEIKGKIYEPKPSQADVVVSGKRKAPVSRLKATEARDVYYDADTDTYFRKDSKGGYTEIKSKTGGWIYHVDEYGSRYESIDFSNASKIYKIDESEKIISESLYVLNSDRSLTNVEYHYDAKDNKTGSTVRNWTKKTRTTYNAEDKAISQETFDKKETTQMDENGKPKNGKSADGTTYEVIKRGGRTIEAHKDSNGKFQYYMRLYSNGKREKCDANGNPL